MRKLSWLKNALILASICLPEAVAYSQTNSPPYRSTGGWRSSQTDTVPTNNFAAPSSNVAVVQSAFYQAANPQGLPSFPTDAYSPVNTPQNNVGLALPPNMPSMPNALNAGSLSSSQNYPSPPPNAALSRGNQPFNNLPQYDSANVNSNDPMGYGQSQPSQNYGNTRGPQIYPPQNYSQPSQQPFQTVATGNELRAVAPNALAGNGNQLRPTNPAVQTGFGPSMQSQPIATGLPFVTPPPSTGRFPTSPYNPGNFQTVSYQTSSQPPLNTYTSQPVLNTANIANTQPVLPQYQSPTYYPTAYQQCAPGVVPTYPPAGAVPGVYVPPTLTPNMTGTYSPNNSGYSPLFSLGQENYNVTLGRGIIGQPTVYVPGQRVRNFLRYLSP